MKKTKSELILYCHKKKCTNALEFVS